VAALTEDTVATATYKQAAVRKEEIRIMVFTPNVSGVKQFNFRGKKILTNRDDVASGTHHSSETGL